MSGRCFAELHGELVEIIPQRNDLRRQTGTLQRTRVPRKGAAGRARCAEQFAFVLGDMIILKCAEPGPAAIRPIAGPSSC